MFPVESLWISRWKTCAKQPFEAYRIFLYLRVAFLDNSFKTKKNL